MSWASAFIRVNIFLTLTNEFHIKLKHIIKLSWLANNDIQLQTLMFRYVSFSTSFAKFVNSTDSINSKYSWWKLGSIEALFMTRYCVTHKMCSAWIKLRSSSAYRKILTDYLKSLFGLVHCWERLPLIDVVWVWFCLQHHSWVEFVGSLPSFETFVSKYSSCPLSQKNQSLIWFVVIQFDL